MGDKQKVAKRGGLRNKYGAKAAFGSTGTKYRSILERDRAETLKLHLAAGTIRSLTEQPYVQMAMFHSYKPDFTYVDAQSGIRVFEDTKGVSTDRFRINVKLWRERGPGLLRISRRKGKIWTIEDIMPRTIDEGMWKRK